MSTAFTELVGCRLPLQLAGMGGDLSDVGLASAVTEAGGLGTLGAGGLPGPIVEQILQAMSSASAGPYGINFLMPFLERDAVELASRSCRVCDFHFGDPDPSLVSLVHEGGALAAWQVGSVDEASSAVDAGCDFVIAQGTQAGGHVRGTKPLLELLDEIVGTVDVPVLAAGGIGTARDVADALATGADGVRVGTRFLAAEESVAHPDYVDALIGASAEDTVLTGAFSQDWPDAPHRVLRSCVAAAEASDVDVVASVSLFGADVPVARFSSMPPTKHAIGNVAAMAMYAGTSVAAVRQRQPAAEIVRELCSEI